VCELKRTRPASIDEVCRAKTLGELLWERRASSADIRFAELLVIPDGEQQVPRDDAGLLVVLGGVPGELKQLGGEVGR
jgi:hypothetical protein